MNVIAWSDGLEVTGGGTGVVSHAGLGLLRCLSDKASLTGGLSRALWSGRVQTADPKPGTRTISNQTSGTLND